MTADEASRVLVVEDEVLIMMATLDMLDELGHTTFSARNAENALETFRREAIDVVVTDVNLPSMDGKRLAAALRNLRPGLPIIFATGYRIVLDIAVIGSGPTAVLSKPFVTSELAQALKSVLFDHIV